MEEVPATKMEVIVYDRKVPLFKDAEITLCGDRITARGEGVDLVFPFDEASAVTVLGKNKANILPRRQDLSAQGLEAIQRAEIRTYLSQIQKHNKRRRKC